MVTTIILEVWVEITIMGPISTGMEAAGVDTAIMETPTTISRGACS